MGEGRIGVDDGGGGSCLDATGAGEGRGRDASDGETTGTGGRGGSFFFLPN